METGASMENLRRTIELIAKVRDIETGMKRQGLSPSGLAEKAFLAPATVLRLFRGRTSKPSYFTIESCCRALGLKLEIEPIDNYVPLAK